MGISMEELRVAMKYLGRHFIHIQRHLNLHGVKIIKKVINKTLYIELDSKKREHHMGQKETNKRRDKKMTTTS